MVFFSESYAERDRAVLVSELVKVSHDIFL
jgi:hypothetical protein